MGKLNHQISVRLTPELREAIGEIEERHRIGAAELVRGLLEAGVDLYRAQGHFSFPIAVVPSRAKPRPGTGKSAGH